MRKILVYMTKILVILGLVVLCGFVFWGCSGDVKPEKTGEIDYTIVSEEEVPKELKTLIDERKESEFRLSFSDGEDLYLVAGYGKQDCGGYSVQVKELYLAGDSIYLDTQLQGPLPEETAVTGDTPATPWIAVKLKKTDKTIYFAGSPLIHPFSIKT